MNREAGQLDALKKKDLHIHTKYCRHAGGEMEDYVKSALDIGLEEIGFLAHVETGIVGFEKVWLDKEDLEKYWREGRELIERYSGLIKISLGLEAGVNKDGLPELEALIAMRPWDRLGLSCHFLPEGGRHVNICSETCVGLLQHREKEEVILEYYGALRDHIPIIKPDLICHLDVIRMYLPDLSGRPRIRAAVFEVLEETRHCGAALEVNTSGYYMLGAPYPAPWVLKQALDMGLEIVLSSDSHYPDQVASFFDPAAKYIEQAAKG